MELLRSEKNKLCGVTCESKHVGFKDPVQKTSLTFCSISLGVGKATSYNSDNFYCLLFPTSSSFSS